VEEALQNEQLARLCNDLCEAARPLEGAERSRRELYSERTNPVFIQAWREYQLRWRDSVERVSFWVAFDLLPLPGSGHSDVWEEAREAANSEASAIETAIELARIEAESSLEAKASDADYEDDLREALEGADAWSGLTKDSGFDLAGVFRRRRLTPFIMVPRHVSDRYGTSDRLSLMARLQQAQEAFVYGVPLAAFALMRVVLDLVLTNHYAATGKDLHERIGSVTDRLPSAIHWAQLQRLKILGNDAVHIRAKELDKIKEQEREIVTLLAILQMLIELAPQTQWEH
jgi:hypothetical protein